MLSRITRSVRVSSILSKRSDLRSRDDGPTWCRATTVDALHTGRASSQKKVEEKPDPSVALVLQSFVNAETKEKEAYLEILRKYKKNNEIRRGHVEFIKAGLKYMDDFGVNRDLAVYKALLDVLPKGKFLPANYFQTLVIPYPKQQYVAIDLLCKMEHNCVIPDVEMQDMLLNIFGNQAEALKKFWRMMYWMPKFANLNPWPCPRPAPKDPRVLAKLAMRKISSVDVQTKITDFETKNVEDSVEDTWIISAMSSLQEELLRKQDTSNPIFVEGPYLVWVADQSIDYFVLRGQAREKKEAYEDVDDVSNIKIPFWDKKEIALAQIVHEQDDGTYFAMCATGTSTKDSLLCWIRCLQEQNPILKVIPVVFKLTSSTRQALYLKNSQGENEIVETKD